MDFGRKEPGERKQKRATWSVEKLKGGGKFNGWLAAPPVWIFCHLPPPSKPCPRELTNGVMKCHRCVPGVRSEWNGYLPIWSDAGGRVCVVVKDYSADILKKIRPNQAVQVRRGSAHHDPIIVEASKWSQDYAPSSSRAFNSDAFHAWLLTLWDQPQLIEFFAGNKVTESDKIEDTVIDPENVPEDISPFYQEAWKRAARESRERLKKKQEGEPPTIGEVDFVPPPSANGKTPH